MIVAVFVFAILAGAFLNRHRGGWLGTGHTQVARLDFAVGMALLLYLASLDWIAGLIAVPLLWLGCLAGQGTDQADDTPAKALGLVASGAVNFVAIPLALIAAQFIAHQPPPWLALVVVPLVALGKPLAYYLAGKLPPIQTVFGQGFARGSTEWGEVLFGAVEGAGIVVAAIVV